MFVVFFYVCVSVQDGNSSFFFKNTLTYPSQHTSSALRLIQERPSVLMSTIHHCESSQTWPGVSSSGHRIHIMPLHQHSGHLCLQTTGDCSQITGDCNQTPVTANERHLWQLSRLEMHAMPQRVMSAVITRRTVLLKSWFLNTGWQTVFRDYLSHVEKSGWQLWRMWRVASDAMQGFPAESRDRRLKFTRPSLSRLLPSCLKSSLSILIHNYLFLYVCCCGCNPLEPRLSY